MCFSASASLIAGSTLSEVGVVTLTKVKRKEEIPLALIPLLFGIQQISEGLIWLSFQFHAPFLNTIMTYVFSVFSHVVWPILVPLAIGLLETVPLRKRILYGLQAVGIAVGLYLLYFLIRFPVTSEILNRSISYESHTFT